MIGELHNCYIPSFSEEKNTAINKIFDFSYEGSVSGNQVRNLYNWFGSTPGSNVISSDEKIYETITDEIDFFSKFAEDKDIGPIAKKHIVVLECFKNINECKRAKMFTWGHLYTVAKSCTLIGASVLLMSYFGASISDFIEIGQKSWQHDPALFSATVVLPCTFLTCVMFEKMFLHPLSLNRKANSTLFFSDFVMKEGPKPPPDLPSVGPPDMLDLATKVLEGIYWTFRFFSPGSFNLMLSDVLRDNLLKIDQQIIENGEPSPLSIRERERLTKDHARRSQFVKLIHGLEPKLKAS